MTIYIYTPDSNTYHSVTPEPLTPVDWPNQFKGKTLGDQWSPLPVRLDPADELGDFMALSAHLPVISERAWKCLQPLIAPEVEVLTLDMLDDLNTTYYLLNVTQVIDCLDKEASDIHNFHGHILHIRRHVIDEDKLSSVGIFRIKGYEIGRCYVTEAFRAIAEANNLSGLLWEPLP